jgi:hypothetical protein
MNNISRLLTEVLKSVLNKPIVTPEYEDFGGSRGIFYSRIKNNSGYLPDGCAMVLKNVILHEVKKNQFRKNLVYDYFKKYLTNDELEYYNRNPDDFESFVIFGLSKFLKPKSSLFTNILKKSYPKIIDREFTIISYSKKVEELYNKLLVSFESDFEIGFSLSKRIQEIICDVILISEGLDESVHKKINILETVYSKNILELSALRAGFPLLVYN